MANIMITNVENKSNIKVNAIHKTAQTYLDTFVFKELKKTLKSISPLETSAVFLFDSLTSFSVKSHDICFNYDERTHNCFPVLDIGG